MWTRNGLIMDETIKDILDRIPDDNKEYLWVIEVIFAKDSVDIGSEDENDSTLEYSREHDGYINGKNLYDFVVSPKGKIEITKIRFTKKEMIENFDRLSDKTVHEWNKRVNEGELTGYITDIIGLIRLVE